MKKCTRCGITKSIENFAYRNKSKGLRRSECRECRREIDAKIYREGKKKKTSEVKRLENRAKVEAYLVERFSVGCADCGEKNIVVLEFDHLPEYQKKYGISRMLANRLSLAKVKEEIDKCEVVCANHHRIRTSIRNGSWRIGSKVLIDAH